MTLYEPEIKATDIANAAMDLLMANFGSRFKTYRRTPMLQVSPTDLPVLGVYLMRERRAPAGNYNHAEPRFQCSITIGYSGAIHAETAEQNELYQLEQWMNEVDETLLSNPKFVRLTEGVESMDRQSQYAKVGETTLFEIRVEMTFATKAWFPPKVEHMLEKVVIDTQYPDKEHADSGTPQIHRVYEIETTES